TLGSLLISRPQGEWVVPYQNLPITLPTKEIEQHLAGKDSAVWQDGDVLNIVHRAKEDPVSVAPGIDEPMKRVPGTEYVPLQLKMPGWDKALIGPLFFEKNAKKANMRDMIVFRGAQAPAPAETVETLKGTVKEYTIKSTD